MKPLNLKQKKPSKFKEKIKNFFHFDMDEVTKEEEPTKVFEKIPLINLTKNKIFLGIFLFLVIVNILVGFGIDFLYIRAILGFLFLVTVPGLLIMLCFKIRIVKFWEFLVYTIGLSIAFIMFAGLIVNWTLPALNITDKPLSLYPILICFDIFLVALGIVGWKRNKDFQPFQFTVPKLDAINNIFFIIPMAFPVLSILGAFLLNNHGSNILTMIMLGGIAVYVLLLTIFRKKLNENIWLWALWLIGLSLLFSYSFRSYFFVGWDIQIESKIALESIANFFWNLTNSNNAYNSCLSITILPTIFASLFKYNIFQIFKILFPLLFSICPIILFLLSRIFFNIRVSFLISLFFIFQSSFSRQMSALGRQEIAIIFFGLVVLVIFMNNPPSFKKIFFLIFGGSMIVSHYSTSYLALTLFFSVYVLLFFLKKWSIKKKDNSIQKEQIQLIWGVLVLLFIFGFLWYNQLTNTGEGLISFVDGTINNLKNTFKEEILNFGVEQFSFNLHQPDINDLRNYISSIKEISNSPTTLLQEQSDSNLTVESSQIIPPRNNWEIIQFNSKVFQILKLLFNEFFIFIGMIILIFLSLKNFKKGALLTLFCVLSLILLAMIIFFPSVSSSYNLTRAYLQLSFFLSLPAVIGGLLFFKLNKKRNIFLVLLLLGYFLFYSGFIFQIFGGYPFSSLNNFGEDYDSSYTIRNEFLSATWLENKYSPKNSVYADASAKLRLSPIIFNKPNYNLFPSAINKNSYVYFSQTNKILEKTYGKFRADLTIQFSVPVSFLKFTKNIIYSNGQSEIFK